MKRNNTLSHTVWDCKYHIVWIPKFRRKVLYYKLRTYLGKIFHELIAGENGRRAFLNEILDVLSLTGGEFQNDV